MREVATPSVVQCQDRGANQPKEKPPQSSTAGGTTIVALVTTNLNLARVPGNVRLRKGAVGLREASVVNVSQVLTIDKDCLDQRMGSLSAVRMAALDAGLRLALSP